MASEQPVARHYTVGGLRRTVLDAAVAAGLDVDRLGPHDLAAVDEFHIGGRQATVDLLGQLELEPDMRLLDVGCGLGGPSRFAASAYGCRVTGVDLTADYVELAGDLARRTGLADRVDYRQADALDLPFEAGSFDGAYMLHVGMNVADKARLCAEVARVLVPGGFFAVYDVMRTGPGELDFPVPWAGTSEISFVEPPDRYLSCLEAAGLRVQATRDRREVALAFFREMHARSAAPPPLGLHLVMGADFPVKVANMISALERAVIAPVEVVARRRR